MSISARVLCAGFVGCLLLVAPDARAQNPAAAAASPGAPAKRVLDVNALSWEVAPPRIILGETPSAEVTVTAKTPEGEPLDTAPPTLTVSTGKVTPPMRKAPGVWTTTFTPPEVGFPHVAILFGAIETKTTTAVGFVSLHLWGKGETTVRTKPGSNVTVFIGNESFGPVAANADGAARVPIIVPPGPEHAVAKSVDDAGNESQKTIDLGVPGFNRLAMMPLDDLALADGTGQARLLVFVVDKKGEPLFQASFVSSATVGDVDIETIGLSPGMFRLTYQPGKTSRKTAKLEVQLEDSPDSKATTSVQLLSGRPAKATIDTPRVALTADEPRAVQLEVRLYDSAGNQVPANAANVDVDFGRIEEIKAGPGGSRAVTWILPAALPPGAGNQATITVRAPSGEVLGTKQITLLPGKAAKLSLEPVEPVIADGSSSVELRMQVLDKAGNPIIPTNAAFEVPAQDGQIVAATVDGSTFRARFIPEARDLADFATITARLGELSTTTQVKVLPRPRARLLVGPAFVAGTNYGDLLQLGPELSLLVRLPGFDGSLHAGLSVAMLQALDVDHRAYPLFAEAAWRPLLGPDVAAHLGAAVGFVLTDEVNGASRAVLPGAAAQAVAGIAYRLGPGFVELDVRGGYGLTFPDAAVGAPLGASASLGYRFGI